MDKYTSIINTFLIYLLKNINNNRVISNKKFSKEGKMKTAIFFLVVAVVIYIANGKNQKLLSQYESRKAKVEKICSADNGGITVGQKQICKCKVGDNCQQVIIRREEKSRGAVMHYEIH